MSFSNKLPDGTGGPSPMRIKEALASPNTFADKLRPFPCCVMSADAFERGKREGWIVQRFGLWVIDWSKT